MTTSPQFLRGSVVLCNFPFDERPTQKGPKEHFCLFTEAHVHNGRRYLAVAYGTSRMDNELMSAHPGTILSVPTQFIKISKGHMAQPVAHFLCDLVALIPESWVNTSYQGRLDCMRVETRTSDPQRQRLFQAFESIEPILENAALAAFRHLLDTGAIGLPPSNRGRRNNG